MLFFIQKYAFLSFLLLNASICISQKQTIFSGTIHELDAGSKVYLSQTAKSELIDSTIVTSDSFRFNLNIEKGDIYFFRFTINLERFDYAVYLQKGADIHVIIDTKNGSVSFRGSKLASEQNDFYKGLYLLNRQGTLLDNELIKIKDSNLIEKIGIRKEELSIKKKDYFENWIRSHSYSPFSIAVIYLFMKDTPVETLKSLYDDLSTQAKENNLVTEALPYYFAIKVFNQEFKIGEHIKDFVLKDTSGTAYSFFSIKGNSYILLDFWASWCGPCRRSTPEISKLLETYNKYNFKVISISADTDSEKWKEAIVKDKMNWYHLSDLKGTDTGFIKENHIFAFPTYVLVSQEGVIISAPNTIDKVKEKLFHIFQNKS